MKKEIRELLVPTKVYGFITNKIGLIFGRPILSENSLIGIKNPRVGVYQTFSLFIIRQKFYLQCQFHSLTIPQLVDDVKQNLLKGEGQFLHQINQVASLPYCQ